MNNWRGLAKGMAEVGTILLGLAILTLATIASGAEPVRNETPESLDRSGRALSGSATAEANWKAPLLDPNQEGRAPLPGGGSVTGSGRGMPGGIGGSSWNDFGPPTGPEGLGWDRGEGWGGFGDPSGMPGGLDPDGMIGAGTSPGNGPYGGINPMRNHGGMDKYSDALDGWKGLAEDRAGKTTGETQVAWEALGMAIDNFRDGSGQGWQLSGIVVNAHPGNPNAVIIRATMKNGSHILIVRDYGTGKDSGGVYVPDTVQNGSSGFGDTGQKKQGEESGSSSDRNKDKGGSDGKDKEKSDDKSKDNASAKNDETKADDDKKSGGAGYTPDDGGSDSPNPKHSKELAAKRGAARAAAAEVALPPNAHVVDPMDDRNQGDQSNGSAPAEVRLADTDTPNAGGVGTTPYDDGGGRTLSQLRPIQGMQVVDPMPETNRAQFAGAQAAAGLDVAGLPPSELGGATVLSVTGSASRMVAGPDGSATWQAIRPGQALPAGTVLRTGLGSSVQLAGLTGQTSIGSGTKLGIDSIAHDNASVSLVYGAVSVRPQGGQASSLRALTVRTPTGAMTLKAAHGGVRYNAAMGLRLSGPQNAWATAAKRTPTHAKDRTGRTPALTGPVQETPAGRDLAATGRGTRGHIRDIADLATVSPDGSLTPAAGRLAQPRSRTASTPTLAAPIAAPAPVLAQPMATRGAITAAPTRTTRAIR